MLILHGFWCSLATYRVRAGLLLKGVAFEKRMHETALADLALASHLAGAERFGVDTAAFPRAAGVGRALLEAPAIAAAHPLRQPGAPAG
jgi:hypothetical protein